MVPPPWGGVSDVGGIAPSSFRAYVFYLRCPACGHGIRHPFSRTSGVIPYIHMRRKHKDCRLLIHPDPIANQHRATIVPENESLEAAFVRALLQAKAA